MAIFFGTLDHGFAAAAHYENRDYLIDNWQGSDGLHENSASSLAQTPDGYLWVGTYGGLVRFNGNDFTQVSVFPEVLKAGESVSRLHVDHAGRLWVATERGILVLEHGVWRKVASFKLDETIIRTFATPASDQLWCGTLDGKLLTIKNYKVEAVTPPTPLFASGVFCCADTQDGSLWLANRAYIGRLTRTGWQAVGPPVADRKPLIATAARNGGLWVYLQATHQLLHYHADGSAEAFMAPAINDMRELYEDHNGMVWIGSTLTGLIRLKPGETNDNRSITIANGLANNVVLAITEDAENNLWVGTGSGGLHRLIARRFFNLGLAQGLPNPIVRAIIQESPGHILVGTHGGGIARIQNGQASIPNRRSSDDLSSASSFIWSALRDHTGRLWLGTFNGGLLFETNGIESLFTPWPGALGKTINALYEDPQNRIWVGTRSGLGIIEHNQARPFLSESDQPLAGANIRCIAENKESGTIWLGTYDHGIYRVAHDQVTQFGTNEGVPTGHVCSLHLDADGCLWAGIFQQGMIGIREGKIIRINRTNGLPASSVCSILEDGRGYVWLGSDRGILRVAAKAMRQIWDDPSAQLAFNTFDANDGLASLECAESFQNTALRDSSGRLWFATQKGVATIDPSSLRLNTNPPPVVIEHWSYQDRNGRKGEADNPGASEPTLPAGVTDLKIDYAALSYTIPERIRYACRLQGARQTWAETNRFHSEIFHTLGPGAYRFEVRAANNDGIWSPTGAAITFQVKPFIWQTIWFWALILGSLAVGVGFGGWRLARVQLRRQLEQLKLQRERVRLAAVLESTSDLVVFVDAERAVLHLNPAGRRLLGLGEPEPPHPLKLADLFAPKANQHLEETAIPAAVKAGTWEGEIAIHNRTGQEIPVSAVIIVDQEADGRINFIAAIARDISERKQAEEKQLRLEEQLRQSQKMEVVGQLSGGVAHDFNNLLAVITGNVSLLELGEPMPPDQRESLHEIKQSAERAATLTRQLLAFSRRQKMKLEHLNLNQVVENMGKMLQRVLGETIRMRLNPAANPVVVHADAGMIEQVLMNLAVNARDAMPSGGDLAITIATVELDAPGAEKMGEARAGAFAVLSVKDSGCGIAPEILTRIFEPFFTTKDVGKGTGLGLATVHGIVKQHRGWVLVQSQPGQGTDFHIYLPLAAAAAESASAPPPAPPKRGGDETILVVEDEPALRKLILRTLSRLGYQMIEADTGRQALEVFAGHQAAIRLVLTDIVMPDGLSGLELTRRLQQQAPALKVIYMSGYSAEITGKDGKLVEGVNFLAKPFSQAQLTAIIRANLEGA